MNRSSTLTIRFGGLLVLACMLFPNPLHAQSRQPIPVEIQGGNAKPPAKPTGAGSDGDVLRPIDQATLNEINQIRQQLGGGIAKQLGELNLKEPNPAHESGADAVADPNADFEQELRRLVAGKGEPTRVPAAGPSASNVTASGGTTIVLPVRPGQSVVVPRNGIVPGKSYPIASQRDSRIAQLRNAARQLDQITAGLEEVGLYDEADRIRRQSHDFWHRARKIDGESR